MTRTEAATAYRALRTKIVLAKGCTAAVGGCTAAVVDATIKWENEPATPEEWVTAAELMFDRCSAAFDKAAEDYYYSGAQFPGEAAHEARNHR